MACMHAGYIGGLVLEQLLRVGNIGKVSVPFTQLLQLLCMQLYGAKEVAV